MQTESEEIKNLFEKIKAIQALRLQYPQLRIPPAYLQKLNEHPGWNSMATEEGFFEASVQARRYLLQLQ